MWVSAVSFCRFSSPSSSQFHSPGILTTRWRHKFTSVRCCHKGADQSARTTKSYYDELLGVSADSSPQQIKEVYRKLQKKHHPDIAGQRSRKTESAVYMMIVLIRILSFLPTPDAVRTCVLSKRWQCLLPHLRSINFDNVGNGLNSRNPRQRLSRATDGIRNELVFKFQFNMKRLRVSFIFLDHIRPDVWLASAVWRKVLEIDLSLLVGERVTLPYMVFTSQSLTVLRIEMDSVLELPTSISSPCLKTLRLSLVSLPSTELIENLLSSSPVLEGLALLDCVWPPMKTITISIPTVKTLEIDDELPSFGSITVPNGSQIKICGRNLVSLKY